MPKDLELVCARYERAVQNRQCPRRADRDAARQARNYAMRYVERSTIETMVRQIVMEQGVSTVFTVQYLNFGRHMAKQAELCSGASLEYEATNAVRDWARKGLSATVLAAICQGVFNVTLDPTAL